MIHVIDFCNLDENFVCFDTSGSLLLTSQLGIELGYVTEKGHVICRTTWGSADDKFVILSPYNTARHFCQHTEVLKTAQAACQSKLKDIEARIGKLAADFNENETAVREQYPVTQRVVTGTQNQIIAITNLLQQIEDHMA